MIDNQQKCYDEFFRIFDIGFQKAADLYVNLDKKSKDRLLNRIKISKKSGRLPSPADILCFKKAFDSRLLFDIYKCSFKKQEEPTDEEIEAYVKLKKKNKIKVDYEKKRTVGLILGTYSF